MTPQNPESPEPATKWSSASVADLQKKTPGLMFWVKWPDHLDALRTLALEKDEEIERLRAKISKMRPVGEFVLADYLDPEIEKLKAQNKAKVDYMHEQSHQIFELRARLAKMEQKLGTARKAFRAISESPGGGPGRRISMQAIAELDKEAK